MRQPFSSDMEFGAPVANLIDVVFLLLIFFVVTFAVVPTEGLITTVAASGSPGKPVLNPALLRLEITPTGTMVGSGREARAVTMEELREHLASSVALTPGLKVQVVIHPDVSQGQAVTVLDTCYHAGAVNLILNTAKPTTPTH